MKKTYSIVLNIYEWAKLKAFLRENKMEYYPSEYYGDVHISLNLTQDEFVKAENFIATKLF